MSPIELPPNDEHNIDLVEKVHPPDWVNPTPAPRYNLVVIGAGTAGLVTAAGAAGIGARVALVERHLMGGDCLNTGCVPSKGVISAARTAAQVRRAKDFGIEAGAPQVDFGKVMARMRELRAGIATNDSVERFQGLGIDVFLGDARFVDKEHVEVGGTRLRFKKAVVATGARAFVPPIPGLERVAYFTNENVFNLTELPGRMVVIGGGPIGCELAQTFQRLGSQVTQVERAAQIIPREDPDAAAIVRAAMERDGVQFLVNANVKQVRQGDGVKEVTVESEGGEQIIETDAILVGVGRAPNVDGLNLEDVGVEYTPQQGIVVDDTLQTTNPAIFACGDVCQVYKFTHAADAAARIVIQNTLFPFLPKGKFSKLVIPWCTYTDPEVAHVGLSEQGAASQGMAIDTYTIRMGDVDRAILEGDTEGILKVHTAKGSGRIVGATLVSAHAGESIGELTTAITHGLDLGKLGKVIHPYPTQAEAIKKAADAYAKTKLTPAIAGIFKKIVAWQR